MDAVRNGRYAFELLYARIKQDSLHCNAKIISRVHDIAQTLEYVMGKTLSWNYHEIEYICEISSENINYFVWIMTQTDPSRSNWYRVPPHPKNKKQTNKIAGTPLALYQLPWQPAQRRYMLLAIDLKQFFFTTIILLSAKTSPKVNVWRKKYLVSAIRNAYSQVPFEITMCLLSFYFSCIGV